MLRIVLCTRISSPFLALILLAGIFLALCFSTPAVRSQSGAPHSNSAHSALAGSRWLRPTEPGPETLPHAAAPFAQSTNQEPACPTGKCDAQKGRLLIKLTSQVQVSNPTQQGIWTASLALNQALAAQGVLRLEAVFAKAQAPKAGEVIISPQGQTLPKPDLTRWQRVFLRNEAADLEATVKALSKAPGVVWVEPDYLRRPAGNPVPLATLKGKKSRRNLLAPTLNPPNDPLYSQQWHLAAINAFQAWSYLESQGLPPGGSRDIVVAVIDTGVDYNHPDLAANMWTNSQETPGNGIDDDLNGYVDDVRGVDVITNSGNPADDHGHGTHVAGIIAAQANNNIGGVGVAYNVQIMAIKAAQYSGVLATSDIAEAIYYAAAKGASVINMSFGGYARSQVEEDALAVGFGQAVLVAAAGNDGLPNEIGCTTSILPKPLYPAALNWVLGVMASVPGGGLANFSNFDCVARSTIEYELRAPGLDIWSTLPNGQYAAWDGTSMAAPIVSGIAALVRTKFNDKNVYSSRFIMGQVAANAVPIANSHAALTVAAKPNLAYLRLWLFDTASQSANNDNDGVVDAGETIDLGIAIRNHWGKADLVMVKLEAIAEGASQSDPYVTMLIDTVDYGSVGSFSEDDNGLIPNSQGSVTGVDYPFRFSVSPTTPNDHVIPFRLTISARNGLDLGDTMTYNFQSRFSLSVRRGRELPRLISQNMTLTKDDYWIVPDQTRIDPGVTVNVLPGTQIQFWSGTQNPNQLPPNAYLEVRGTFVAVGTSNEPIQMFTGLGHDDKTVKVFEQNDGIVNLQYVIVDKPEMVAHIVDHCIIRTSTAKSVNWAQRLLGITIRDELTNTIFDRVRGSSEQPSTNFRLSVAGANALETNLFSRGQIGYKKFNFDQNYGPMPLPPVSRNNVFLNNWVTSQDGTTLVSALLMPGVPENQTTFVNNAFLNPLHLNFNYWLWVFAGASFCYVQGNYWGTISETVINSMVYDFYDNFNQGRVIYQPVVTTPSASTYPFVVNVTLTNNNGQSVTTVGAETITFTVTFNRDMDMAVQPQVSLGPSEPYTDFTIQSLNGGWQNSRTWKGNFTFTPLTGDGFQFIRIAGARAVDDPWLITGDDGGRFRFEIITSGTAAMNLQANGSEGSVDVTWTQNDFDLLAGFNLYRATSANGVYSRINNSLIPPDQHSYTDTSVQSGQPYFYKFTVVKAGFSESGYSNTATATPIDTISPVISHTPVTTAQPGLSLTINADVTDNVRVQAVNLFFRAIGAINYTNRAMLLTTGNRYSATIEGSLVTAPGLEYYIEATDGVSTTRHGLPDTPYRITVADRPVITTVTPNRGPAAGGTAVTIAGSNFQNGATVTFGGAAASNVTVVNANQITCTTPPHFPAAVDVIVTNSGNQTGTLLQAFTYESGTASLSLPNSTGGQNTIVQIPINSANIQGLAAADIQVTFTSSVLTGRTARTGSLTAGWSLVSNTNTPGQINISMASPGGTVSGAGTLAVLEFSVVGAPGASSPLDIVTASLNGGAIPVQLTDGVFQVNQVYQIAGAVSYWNGAVAIPGTLLSLNGDRLYTTTSLANGSYTVSGIEMGNYTLTPSKSDSASEITALDASLALQHAAGLATLTGNAAIAADVDKNGAINSLDAFYILQYAVGALSLPFPGAGIVWQFSPANRTYSGLNSNQSNQNFTATLLGDVTGNWSGAGGGLRPTVTATLSLPEATLQAGNQTALLLALNPTQALVLGADLRINYNPAVISVAAVETGSLASDWLVATNLQNAGEIRVSLAGSRAVNLVGELLRIRVQAVGNNGSSTALTLSQGRLNEGSIVTTLQHGQLTIAQATSAPLVSNIAPAAGAAAGGTGVVIKGANFLPGATVTLGGVAATGVYVINSTTLTATTKPHAAGVVDVVVKNPGGSSGTLTRGYSYSDGSLCPARLQTTSQSFAAKGGGGTLTTAIPTGCAWTASSNDSWINITAAGNNGNGAVNFFVAANTGAARSGTLTIAGQAFTVLQGAQFLDVSETHPFYEFIGKLSARGVTLGCNASNYCPETQVTREQMAAFIIRALGDFSPPTPQSQRFIDVPSSNPFYAFIEQMALRQITLGCGGNNYCPTSPVTREQMAAFMIRALHEPGYVPPTPGQQRFNDVPSTNPFYAHIEEMAVRQITLGCQGSPPLYCPTSAVTRGQMAAFLVRAFNL
jgi:subtilisin family serine protease